MRVTWKTWTLRKKEIRTGKCCGVFCASIGISKIFYDASKNTFDNQSVNCRLQQFKRNRDLKLLHWQVKHGRRKGLLVRQGEKERKRSAEE